MVLEFPLVIEELTFRYRSREETAIRDINLSIEPAQVVLIAGASGCGKTTLAKAILRLLPRNVSKYSGKVYLDGTEIMALGDEEFRRDVRWVKMAMVPQAAMNSLNPVMRVGAKDVPIPFSPVMEQYVLPQVTDILAAVERVFKRSR